MSKNNPIPVTESDGITRTTQIVGISDSYGNGQRANGKNVGTLFGDDSRVTRRSPIASGKYSQGLPLHVADWKINATGYVEVVNNGGILNGVIEFGTGTDPLGKIYLAAKLLNRYPPAQLSYYIFTGAWNGLINANGDCIALLGASLPGLAIDGQDGDIKEGHMYGFVRESGVIKEVLRTYKNFNVHKETVISSVTLEQAMYLNIFELEVGYLGIHPTLLYRVNTDKLSQDLIAKSVYQDSVTSVNDPNLSMSAYVENLGNTTNVAVRNGSFQYGNYSDLPSPDPSARPLNVSFSGASISSGTTVLSIYTVPNKIDMYSRLDSGGTTVSEFRNTIRNKLKKIISAGESNSNKAITLSVYLVPLADISGASFSPLNPYINVLEQSTVGTVNFANAILLTELADIRGGDKDDVRMDEYLLFGDTAGVVTVTSTGNINEVRYTLITEDQF